LERTVFNIALLQMIAGGIDQTANLAKGEDFCRRAKTLDADLALFPEMWNIGYTFFDRNEAGAQGRWASQAIDVESEFVAHFRQLARELDMAIALTYLERWPIAPRNSLSLIDRHGEILFTYAKVHTCEFDSEAALTPGADWYVATLDTRHGPINVGAMICYDREFPESARILMLKGAEVILTPNACELEINRLSQYRARAYENMTALAMTNYAAPQENGHSIAFDGIAFDDHGSRDMTVIEADGREEVFIATLDLDRLRHYRAYEVWGNAYRKPSRYALLTSTEIHAPFIRSDARG
jgi:N-carbamoylputrescine amidase